MRMSVKSYDNMNALAAMCFDANAEIDNLAYCLDYHYYKKIADVVHLKVAHAMPLWADLVTDQMLELSARPTRRPIPSHEEDFETPEKAFAELLRIFSSMRKAVSEMIESADMAGDDEVRIFGEDFLMRISPFIKQACEWEEASKALSPADMNIHIGDYTHFITA